MMRADHILNLFCFL
uniref:Uncharacterized protein n=1 Tax=Anguilla anguilla TaxID=7936 RepID=A0A0E9PM57_ANGAN